ncbi:ATP-grasp domain-containing protein [Brenneria tiliae]|uniref:ATP-grasp domain-containing protein n=1 Tax=Brenneria tiliae TaxID=2914984 RepID=A0ABT0MVQ4_9GAMM|nr:hypothetical protein [Brenneria tiliae]MCL2893928.1 hypothetical protein [Brenneria tiliae]
MDTVKYLLVLDYLPSRINEIIYIRDYVKEKYNLDMVIISDMLSGEEEKVCRHVYHLPISSEDYIEAVLKILQSIGMECACILPFMDAVSGHAAILAKKLELYGDDPVLSFAGINKIQFREQEKLLSQYLTAQQIVVPKSVKVDTYEQLEHFFDDCGSGIVIKPIDGRANIGVRAVTQREQLKSSYDATLLAAQGNSILAEELIAFDSEFSFDGVGILSFLTQKVIQSGEYPVELGQIVPAQCSGAHCLALIKAGQSMNLISGQRYGAFHNEIKLNSSTGETFLVETNRRPAGMRIWDMANKVFNISLHDIWLDHLIKGYSDRFVIPEAQGSGFLVNLLSPKDGCVAVDFCDAIIKEKLVNCLTKILDRYQYEIIAIKINIAENSLVHNIPKTNNDFCGYVCVYIKDSKVNHRDIMQVINQAWGMLIQEYIF